MANKKEKDKQLQDKLQVILADLLKDDDNKYCVDCDSKGPRWASWTLGIFLCIRCAGIHRNLGVHLSRVKSVNLDSWTPQQVAMMKEIGNSRGRAIYEANLEDNFRRPQTDSSLEHFIRDKYEHKKYIAKEWIAPTPSVDAIAEEIRRLEQNQNKKRVNYNASSAISNTNVARRDTSDKIVKEIEEKPQNTANKIDLLGLDNDPIPNNNIVDDTFGDFVFAAQPSTTMNSTQNNLTIGGTTSTSAVSSAVDDLMGLNLGNGDIMGNNMPGMINMGPSMSTPAANTGSNVSLLASATGIGGKMDKSSILALYNSNNSSSASAMGSMTSNHQSAWPQTTGPSNTYHTADFHSQAYMAAGNNWKMSGQPTNTGAFGVQHNPFFNSSLFSGHTAAPISQTSFPTGVSSSSHPQPPNQMLW